MSSFFSLKLSSRSGFGFGFGFGFVFVSGRAHGAKI